MTLPTRFVEMLGRLGPEYAALPEVLSDTPSPTAIRLNAAKCARYGVRPAVAAGGKPVAWAPEGLVLPERPAFTLDPAMHQGLYYVQDASSMAAAAAVKLAADILGIADRPLRFLDACAAPGGKTTAALDVLPPDAFVVANEFDPRRASILDENLAKWGRPAVVTVGSAADPWRLPGFFDIIAADVPCSGEGMMRKEPQAVAQWSEGLVESCASLQLEIVNSLWDALAPGGFLVYSTCTFNPRENEDVISWLIDSYGAEPIPVGALETGGVLGPLPGNMLPVYHFLPGMVEGEGQFVAMLRKPINAATGRTRLNVKADRPEPFERLLDGDYSYVRQKDGGIFARPTAHLPLIAAVAAARNVRRAGIEVGHVKGRDLIPAQPLAMAVDRAAGPYHEVEVDRNTALDYLRRQAVTLPADTPRGHVLLTYGGAPLGFVKHLGNRTNNLYPAPWRILHS